MKISFFGSSLVSAYWNGAATYYRGLIKALHARGHQVTFYEPDAFRRQEHRDMPDPDWAEVVVYAPERDAARPLLARAKDSDLIVKASGVGVLDKFLEASVLDLRGPERTVAFWDVDAPATLERLDNDPDDPFHEHIPEYDLVFTYGGGQPVIDAYTARGAKRCVPIYNALDPDTHHPVPTDPRFQCDLGFMGNRLPDREARVDAFFLEAARLRPEYHFLIGGNGWPDVQLPPNVLALGHVFTRDHNAFNTTPRMVLNINRDGMARFGFSPATRVFEAAGAAACIITDAWRGVEMFFEPGEEWLVAESGADVAQLLDSVDAAQAERIGKAAYARVLAEHTYTQRALDVERALEERPAPCAS